MKNLTVLFLLLVGLATGCTKNEDSPAPATNNVITFGGTDWQAYPADFGEPNPNSYLNNRTTAGNSYSLPLSATAIKDTSTFSYWVAGFQPGNELTIGKTLTLRAKVRLDNVQGTGISLALRGDTRVQTAALFASTQTQKVIRGTADFTEYTLTLPYTKSVDLVSVYLLLLPKTTGTVTFSDVSVEVN
ncbi:hypothetical protein GCM10027341_23880 [Spirosoma knui]